MRHDATYQIGQRRGSHSVNLRIHKSQILFESDTYIWNIIQLSKFIELLLLYLSIHYPTLFMGECWSYKQIVVVYLPTYISIHRTYSRVYYHSPSVACQHTEGEYHLLTTTYSLLIPCSYLQVYTNIK